MGAIAFVFSGQGDQYPGMGKELCDTYAAAADVFHICEVLRPGTVRQCFEGTADELKETKNTQPCLFAMEMAAAEVLMDKGIMPNAVAGFSLGEVVAATVAGIFDRETGFKLVSKRGELMQTESEQYDTAMAAVVKLTTQQVCELTAKYDRLYPVNFNCPGNITVSGLVEQMSAFSADVKAAGGRALPLKVKGAFHSPFMADAATAFGAELEKVELGQPRLPLYSNVTAQPYCGNPAALLAEQIKSPVQWESIIRNMIASGIDTFIEIGPGKTLTNMIKKIDMNVRAYTFTEYLEESVC